jgi:hypothetical protein
MANFKLSPARLFYTRELGHLMAHAYKNDPIRRVLMRFEHLGDYWAAWLRHDFSRLGEKYYKSPTPQLGKSLIHTEVEWGGADE